MLFPQTIEFDEGWHLIQQVITKLKNVLEGNSEDTKFTSDDFMQIYMLIYSMCLQKPPHEYSQQLYDKYREIFADYFSATVLPSLREKHDEFMLRDFVKRWSNHKFTVRLLSGCFRYLDRFLVPRRLLPSLNEVGSPCFRDLVYQELKGKLVDTVISLIDREREGEQIDGSLLKNVVDIFIELGGMDHYENDFETTMLKDTSSYYSRKASSWSLEVSSLDYLLKAEECLKREKDRVSHYLHSSTEIKLLEKVRHAFFSSVYATQLMEQEQAKFRACLIDRKAEDLSRMCGLFSTILKSLEPVTYIFKQHIAAEVTDLVKQAEDIANNNKVDKKGLIGLQEQVLVQVLELQDKYLAYAADLFMNNLLFYKRSFWSLLQDCNNGVAGSSGSEILATFFDNVLKKGGREKPNDEDIDKTLEKAVKLVSSIHDKDLFAEFYRKKLSRQLLFDKCANDEHERNTITKLKHEYGGVLTSKMEGMVRNLMVASEDQSRFEEYLGNNSHANPGIDFTVTVLTFGFWPSYKSCNLNLPAEMVKCVEVFKEFYQTKTEHRKLRWIYSLGTCNINANFEPKTMELIVTTYQASALLLFNASDRLSYQEIMAQLNLSDDDVVRLLYSLSCAKYKILTKEPDTKTISPTDVFEFNSKFTGKMRRIRIPLPPVNEKKVIDDVVKDRRYAIDASLVRIKKSRKVLDHQKLVMECTKQLSHMFKPDVKAIKKRIEDLINHDYLERDKNNPKLYKYLA